MRPDLPDDRHGHERLAASAVVVINAVRERGMVDVDKLRDHFARRCRAVVTVPFDRHLETGAEIVLDELAPATRRAYVRVAAAADEGGRAELYLMTDDVAATVDGHGDAIASGLERRLEDANHREVSAEVGQVPLGLERGEQPAEVAGRRGQVGRRHIDRVQPDDGVHLERSRGEVFAHDLAVDLTLGRDVDDRVAQQRGRAGQPPVVGQTVLLAVRRLELARLGDVIRGRCDPVLRERAERRRHRAPAADPSAATHGIDVHAERAGGDRRTAAGAHEPDCRRARGQRQRTGRASLRRAFG